MVGVVPGTGDEAENKTHSTPSLGSESFDLSERGQIIKKEMIKKTAIVIRTMKKNKAR